MTPEEMAAIHRAAMTTSAPWSVAAFRDTLADKAVFSVGDARGFALGRVVLDEAELLTISVLPAAQGKGHGRTLLAGFEAAAAGRGARTAFLEVAEDNPPALALYRSAGWTDAGRRPDYYPRPEGRGADALILRKSLAPA